METLPISIQRVALTLTHNSTRTGVSSLIEELFGYLKERYQVGEVLDFASKKFVETNLYELCVGLLLIYVIDKLWD